MDISTLCYKEGGLGLFALLLMTGRKSESHRLEKTCKIIKSNHQPNTSMPTKPYLEVPHLHVFLNTSRDGDSTTSLGSLLQCLTTVSVKKHFSLENTVRRQSIRLLQRKQVDFKLEKLVHTKKQYIMWSESSR